MLIREVADPAPVNSAPRALVYRTVDWSAPERASRLAFREAAERLSGDHPALGIAFFSIREEDEAFREFFASHGHKIPIGDGGLIWLEYGRKVDASVAAYMLGASGIVERTLALWGG